MHIFEVKTLIGNNQAEAVLLATNAPNINGTLAGKNDYRTQEKATVGITYPLSYEAIKNGLSLDKVYEVTGSWIKGVLHLTSAKAVQSYHTNSFGEFFYQMPENA